MLIERVLAAALSLKAAYEDLRPDDPAAAAKWQEVVDAVAVDMTEARKTNVAPDAGLAEYLTPSRASVASVNGRRSIPTQAATT